MISQKCKIVIYKQCKILPNRNFAVDNLLNYLENEDFFAETNDLLTSSKFTFDECQYVQPTLELKYKLILPQRFVEAFRESPRIETNWNYLKMNREVDEDGQISSARGRPYFYFIETIKRIADNCIELGLKLDVINSFLYQYRSSSSTLPYQNPPTNIVLSPKTMILREHKNRWFPMEDLGEKWYAPNIDMYSEGINAPLYKQFEGAIYNQIKPANVIDPDSWYLIYKSKREDETAPIDIFACKDVACYIKGNTKYNGYLTFQNYDVVVIYGDEENSANIGASVSFTFEGIERTISIRYANEVLLIGEKFVMRGRRGTGNQANNLYLENDDSFAVVYWGTDSPAPTLYVSGVAYAKNELEHFDYDWYWVIGHHTIPQRETNYFNPENALSYQHFPVIDEMTSNEKALISSIKKVNRADPLIVKIIALPYAPMPISQANGEMELSIDSAWEVAQGNSNFPTMLRYKNTNTPICLRSQIHCANRSGVSTNFNPFYQKRNRQIENFGSVVKRLYNSTFYDLETKLLHSDYQFFKVVYDNASFIFRAELLNGNDYSTETQFELEQLTSLNFSSKFVLRVADFLDNSRDDSDYSGMLVNGRNNELPLFNSAYLNYIRSGYNFDVKTKNRQMTSNILTSSLGIAGGVASAIFGGAFGVAGGVALITSSIAKIANVAFTTAQAEQNIAQKLKTAEMQGVSVAGSDDVDVMREYTNGNKAKMVRYRVSDKMWKVMFDLFYYGGYVANYQGIPNTNTRKWFNYVQADIVFEIVPNLPKDICEEISNKYKEGITFLHQNNDVEIDGVEYLYYWDFEQQYENWETFE